LAAEAAIDLGPVRAAHAQANPGLESHDVVTRCRRTHLADAVEIHNCAAMNAREPRRVQLFVETAQWLAQHWASSGRVEARVVAACLDPFDFSHMHDLDTSGRLNTDALEVFVAARRHRFGVRAILQAVE